MQQPPFSYFLNCRLNSPQVANVVFRKLDLASGYKLDVTKLFFGQPQMKLWSRYPINHKMFSFIILTGNTFIFFYCQIFFVIFFQLQTLATPPPLSLLAMNSRDYGNDHFQGQQNNIFSLRFGSFMKKKSLVFVIKQNHYS